MPDFLSKLDEDLRVALKIHLEIQEKGVENTRSFPSFTEGEQVPVLIQYFGELRSLIQLGFKFEKQEGKHNYYGTIALKDLEAIVQHDGVKSLYYQGEISLVSKQNPDPRISSLLKKVQQSRSVRSFSGKSKAEKRQNIEFVGALIKFRQSPDFLSDLGCQVSTILGHFASVRIPLAVLEEVVAHPDVLRIETNRGYKPDDLDSSIKEINADDLRNSSPPFEGTDKYTGSGVIVAIIDSGFDYKHKVFRDPSDDQLSRILFLYDQSLTPTGTEIAPSDGLGGTMIGVEYDQADIELALADDDPSSVVRQEPGSHGTHVAGIAAGNGSQSGNCHGAYHYVGVAPDADLIMVRLLSGGNQLGNSNNLIDAIGYLRRKSNDLEMPMVINMSFGDNLGAHDGSSLVEEMLDLFLTILTPDLGWSIVKSAGNLGDEDRHAQTEAPANNTANPVELKFQVVSPDDVTDGSTIELDIWYPDANSLDIEIIPPGNNITGTNTASPGDNVSFTEDTNNSTITIDSQNAQSNSQKRIFITIDPDVDNHVISGEWLIKLSNTTATEAPFNAYIERDQLASFKTFKTNEGSISIPGTSKEVITVGNYNCKGKGSGGLADSSSRGPTTDGRMKPEISAPGTNIISARQDPDAGSCCDCCYDFYVSKSGTSMATPHVTGAIALLLEKNPNLTHAEIKQAITVSARKDDFTGEFANNEFGEGKLDVAAALDEVDEPEAGIRPVFARRSPATPIPAKPKLAAIIDDPQPFFAEGTPISRFTTTPHGAELHQLIMQHYQEVRNLVNRNKRVATVWQRNKGPLIIHHVIRSSMLPHVQLPQEIEGQPILHYLENIAGALREHGTQGLQDALKTVWPFASQLPGKSFHEAIDLLEEGSV